MITHHSKWWTELGVLACFLVMPPASLSNFGTGALKGKTGSEERLEWMRHSWMRMSSNCSKKGGQIISQLQIWWKWSKVIKIRVRKTRRGFWIHVSFMENQYAYQVATVQLLPYHSLLEAESSLPHPSQLIPFWYNSNDHIVKNAQESRGKNRELELGVPHSDCNPTLTLVVNTKQLLGAPWASVPHL